MLNDWPETRMDQCRRSVEDSSDPLANALDADGKSILAPSGGSSSWNPNARLHYVAGPRSTCTSNTGRESPLRRSRCFFPARDVVAIGG